MNGNVVIAFEDVVQRFRLITERPETPREAFARALLRTTTSREFEALRHISFAIRKGEVVGVIGRNGSGKSTILKIIAGIYVPTDGRVVVKGTVAPLIDLGAGFHPELTGQENILIGGLLLGLSRREIAKRMPRIIEFAELGDFIETPVKQYSVGMYMRLAFALASDVDADILLVDEILSVGDAGFQRKCLERMEKLIALGKTIVFVSHDVGTVSRLCSRVLWVNEGKLLADGPAADVIPLYATKFNQVGSARSA